jgi:hypothetical protein
LITNDPLREIKQGVGENPMAKNVEAKAFEVDEALGHPENQIVAIVDDSGRLNEIVHEFSDKGFMSEESDF